jgi:gliding motility-associated lipoprotein GldD
MKHSRLIIFCIAITSYCLYACNSPFVPKPRGYFKINLPNHEYQTFNQPGYPYTFEYPVYAKVVKDSTFFEAKAENDWWINIDFPGFDSRIYISYKPVKNNDFNKMIADAFNLTYKHSSKASSIDDSAFRTPNNISGVLFKVGGNAATANQFFLTDSVNHFLRGALYFDAPPNEDSLQPANEFLRQDMQHLINSFQWKK